MSEYNVVVKSVKPVRVASRRETIPEFSAIGSAMDRMYKEVASYIDEHNGRIAGPGITIWHASLDAEAVLPVDKPLPDGDRVRVRELPGDEMACVVHRGAFEGFREAYESVRRWIGDNGYRITGPGREVYLHFATGGDPKANVTEIQFPVAKA
jgi:effector-binding domain-containing protein